MKTKFKILVLALALGASITFVGCSNDDSDFCDGLSQEECDRLL